MTAYKNTPERFWSLLDRSGDCWLWRGSSLPRGYGLLSFGGRNWYAHRLAWFLTNGPIPPGLFVLHQCDNPPCCNPAHLTVGTQAENIAGAVARNRMDHRPKPPHVLEAIRAGRERWLATRIRHCRAGHVIPREDVRCKPCSRAYFQRRNHAA